jgi:hypothetical protein
MVSAVLGDQGICLGDGQWKSVEPLLRSFCQGMATALSRPRRSTMGETSAAATGRTTLALTAGVPRDPVTLDLEAGSDRVKLAEPKAYLTR